MGQFAQSAGSFTGGKDGHVNLVGCKLREEVGIVGKGFELDTGSVGVHAEKLGAIGGECDLFDAIVVDEFEKV